MNGTNLIKIAIRALANNKLRGFLTMLGIIIGVASVITMLAIGQGSKRSIQAQISEMGSNMIMIHPGADVRGGVRQDASAMETLKLQDYEDIVDETRFVSAVSPSVNSSGQAIYGANNVLGYYGSESKTRAGWTLGAGLEYAITNNLTVKGEYLYYNLGKKTVAVNPVGLVGGNFGAKFKNDGHLVRAGLNWKF